MLKKLEDLYIDDGFPINYINLGETEMTEMSSLHLHILYLWIQETLKKKIKKNFVSTEHEYIFSHHLLTVVTT